MRQNKVLDAWSHISDLRRYSSRISKISIKNVEGFNNLDISLNSGMTVVCGRNGSGKTTFLKIIYKVLSKDEDFFPDLFSRLNLDDVVVTTYSRANGERQYYAGDTAVVDNIEYFDPADLCLKIQSKIFSDTNVDDWIEGIDPNQVLNDNIKTVRRVTGKMYENVDAYEVSGVLPNDEVFPFFKVKLKGNTYTNESMGLGEHKLLLMLWKVLSIEKDGLLLIEEPEAFVCPKSQNEFMDVLASIGSSKRAFFIVTSHSEHIVSKANSVHGIIFSDRTSKGFSVVSSKHSFRYLEALGLKAPKTGSILVEDEFAAKVLLKIFAEYDSPLLHSHYVDIQKGESNIEKLLKHNKSTRGFKFIGLFDADHKGKVDESKYDWPICFLPGKSKLSPEELVINEVKYFVKEYSSKISRDEDDVLDAFTREVDHHDFFSEASTILKIETSVLEDIGIGLWINKNKSLIEEFVFVLENQKKPLTGLVSYDGNNSKVSVNDTHLFATHQDNNVMDFSTMNGAKVEGYVAFSGGIPLFRVEM